GVPGAWHRLPEADDDQGNRRGDRSPSFDRQPCGFEQIRAHAAGRFRVTLLLLRGGARAQRRRPAAADPETPRQENDRRGGPGPPAYRRTHHRTSARGRNSSDSPYRRKISRRYAHPVHSSETGSYLDGGSMNVIYRGIGKELSPKMQEKLSAKFAKISKLVEKRGEKEAHVVVSSE